MKKLILLYILILSTIYPLATGTKPNTVRNNFKKGKNGQILLRYNQKGEVVEQYALGKKRYNYDANDNLQFYEVNEFDSLNNISKRITFNEYNEEQSHIHYTADKNGRILSLSNESFYNEYQYDSSGKIEKIIGEASTTYFKYNEDETIKALIVDDFTYKYIYDEDKKLIKEEAFNDNEIFFHTEIVYDDEGYISSFVFYNYYTGKKEYAGKLVLEYD